MISPPAVSLRSVASSPSRSAAGRNSAICATLETPSTRTSSCSSAAGSDVSPAFNCRRPLSVGEKTSVPSTLVPEVDELDGEVGDRLAHELDRRLQVVPLRARDAHRVALDRGGDLELGVLDQLRDLLAALDRDAVLDRERALDLVARDLLERAGLERAHVDVSLGEAPAQDVAHL